MAESDPLPDSDEGAANAALFNSPAPELDPFPGTSTFKPPGDIGKVDVRAKQEAAKLAQGVDLEEDGKTQEHNRYQSFRNHINLALIILFWIMAVAIMTGIVVYAWHVIAPDKYKFLSDKAFDKLQTLLGSIVLSSALSGYVKQRME